MDRGIPTEAVLAEMRVSEPPTQYLVGTPKGRLNRLEAALLMKPWQEAREGVKVKLLPDEGELQLLLARLQLHLPAQPKPRITSAELSTATAV
jgi:hypothetical protein